MVAAATGSSACLQLLVQQGIDLNCSNDDGDTPLHVAVRREAPFVARFGRLVCDRAQTIKVQGQRNRPTVSSLIVLTSLFRVS